MGDCPECGEYMYVDEEWKLRPGRAVGTPVEDGDYVHARCHPSSNDTKSGGSDGR